MKSQVTTKKGDGGQTRALSGDHFPKCHPIMECVGNVDELRAQIGLLRQAILAESLSEAENHAAFLLWVMHTMFPIGSACSDPVNKHPEYRKLELGAEHIAKLEAEQSRLEERVRLPCSFVVAASNLVSAHADVACTVARRLERSVVRLKELMPTFEATHVLVFLNRLSDYLFILARDLEQGRYSTLDYRVLE